MTDIDFDSILESTLKNKDGKIREAAIALLSLMTGFEDSEKWVLPLLLEGLKDKKCSVRCQAVKNLYRFWRVAFTPLSEAAQHDQAWQVRCAAVLSLRKLCDVSNNAEVIQSVKDVLSAVREYDHNYHVQEKALRAITEIDAL